MTLRRFSSQHCFFEKGNYEPLLPEYISSENVRTRNDCEDKREAEEEKGVAVEIAPV